MKIMKIVKMNNQDKVIFPIIFLILQPLEHFAISGYYQDMELDNTYFETEDGFFVGWFDKFPEDVTQGKSLEELEEMLTDMYECLNLAK